MPPVDREFQEEFYPVKVTLKKMAHRGPFFHKLLARVWTTTVLSVDLGG